MGQKEKGYDGAVGKQLSYYWQYNSSRHSLALVAGG